MGRPPLLRWRHVLIALALLSFGVLTTGSRAEGNVLTGSAGSTQVDLYLFVGTGCPYCAREREYLATLEEVFPGLTVHEFEVYDDLSNRELLFALVASAGGQVTGVPVTFVGEHAWTGFGERTAAEIRGVVERYVNAGGAPDAMNLLPPELRPRRTVSPVEGSVAAPAAPEAVLDLPLIGAVDLSNRSLWVATGLIALVDGVNPCSLWVLALLLALVINTGSRRRVLLVGLAFLSVTAAAYGLFIVGLFSAFALVSFSGWIRAGVAAIAVFYAAVGIKDYFALKQGLSFTIGEAQKPGLYRKVRAVVSSKGSLTATLLATGGMALGATLVELPCTAGFPVLWTQLVGAAGVSTSTFVALLLLYMLVYLLDELAVFAAAVVTMHINRVGEDETRVLKLIGGTVMLALAAALLLRPGLLESMTGALVVFGGGAAVGFITLLIDRGVRARLRRSPV